MPPELNGQRNRKATKTHNKENTTQLVNRSTGGTCHQTKQTEKP